MVRPLVAAWIEPQIDRCRKHAGMLARAIVVDGLGAPSGADQLPRRGFAYRPMGAAGKIAFIESRFGQKAPHRFEMNGIAAVRGASHGKLVLAKPKGIGSPALDERNGLQRLDG